MRPTRSDPRAWVQLPPSESPGRWCWAFLGLYSAVIFACRNTKCTAALSNLSTWLTLPNPNSLPVSLQLLLPPYAPLPPWGLLSPTPSQLPCSHSLGTTDSLCHISGLPSLPHNIFSGHLSCQDPHPVRGRAPTCTAKKLEPHFPGTSFPAHPASLRNKKMCRSLCPPGSPISSQPQALLWVFLLANPHLNLGILEVQDTRGLAELCDQ